MRKTFTYNLTTRKKTITRKKQLHHIFSFVVRIFLSPNYRSYRNSASNSWLLWWPHICSHFHFSFRLFNNLFTFKNLFLLLFHSGTSFCWQLLLILFILVNSENKKLPIITLPPIHIFKKTELLNLTLRTKRCTRLFEKYSRSFCWRQSSRAKVHK